MNILQNLTLYHSVGAVLIATLVMHFFVSAILKQLSKHANKTKTSLDDHLIQSISAPVKTLVWFFGVYFSIHLLKYEAPLLSQISSYVNIVPVFIITWGILRVISSIESYLSNQKKNSDQDLIRLIARLVKILIAVSVALGIAQHFGFSISSLLTFGGVSGIVVGFAAKDMLSNIFGGLMLQMDRPFSTGDWVRSSQFEGVVEKIGWRMTRIRTFSKNPIYIPNSIFSSIPIETPSRMSNRRIKEVIGIRYDDIKQIPNIITEVEAMLKAHSEIDQSIPPLVYFNYFNASSLDFNTTAFTKTTRKTKYQQVKQEILLNIAEIIAKHKAEIAYPTQTLQLQK